MKKRKDPGFKKPTGKKGYEAGRSRPSAVASRRDDATDLKRTKKIRRGDT